MIQDRIWVLKPGLQHISDWGVFRFFREKILDLKITCAQKTKDRLKQPCNQAERGSNDLPDKADDLAH